MLALICRQSWRRLPPRQRCGRRLWQGRQTTTWTCAGRSCACGIRWCRRATPVCGTWPCRWSGKTPISGAPSASLAMQSTPAVCAMPSIIKTPGNTGFSGKCPMKCGSLIVTFLMPMPWSSPSNVDDPVDHEKWIAVRQHLEHHRDISRFKLGDHFIHDSRLTLSLPTCWHRIGARVLRGSSSRGTTESPVWPASLPSGHRRARHHGRCWSRQCAPPRRS